MSDILIVAYGNPLRRDDGLAWRAADELETRFSESDVEIIRLHQLVPEIADTVRDRKLIIFLDAASAHDEGNSRPGQIKVKDISHESSGDDHAEQFSHVYSPSRILNLARGLYQENPEAFVVTVTGENFEHGDRLSDSISNALPALVAKVEKLVRDRIST